MKQYLFSIFLLTGTLFMCTVYDGVAQTFQSRSEIKLPAVFSSNMVIRRNSKVPVWGWGMPKEKVRITTSWDGKSYSVYVDSTSLWQTAVQTPEAGGPYTITISGKYDVILSNVMSGDVWFCSGQSNMEWSPMSLKENGVAKGVPYAEAALKNADNYPNIRYFAVRRAENEKLQQDCIGAWTVSGTIHPNGSAPWHSFSARH